MKSLNRTIVGRVAPCDQEQERHHCGLMLVTDDNVRYYVEPGGRGAALQNCLGDWVDATCSLQRRGEQRYAVVSNFRLIEDGQALWETDYEDEESFFRMQKVHSRRRVRRMHREHGE